MEVENPQWLPAASPVASPKGYLGSREPWRRMRARGLSFVEELGRMLKSSSSTLNPEQQGRSLLLCKGLHDLWLAVDTVLDTQGMMLSKEMEQRHKETADHKHELARVRKEEKMAQAAVTPTLDFTRIELQDLPHAIRAVVEENRALKGKIRSYKARAVNAERLLSDVESAIIQLELDNAKLNLQIKECSISPEKVAELKKTTEISASKDEVIKDLENRLRVITEKAQSDKRLFVQQIKGLQRQLAIINDNQEACIAAYTQPLIYVKNHVPPSTPPAAQLPNIGEPLSTETSDIAKETVVSQQPSRMSPKRVQSHVVRAVMGPAAHGTGHQILPSLSGEASNVSSNKNSRSNHKRASGSHRPGEINMGRQPAMQILTPGDVQPFVGRAPHLAAYPEQGGSDPTLIRAVNSNALVLRVIPSPQPAWQSVTSPTSAQNSPGAAAVATPVAIRAASTFTKSPYLSSMPSKTNVPLQVLVQPVDATAQQQAKPPASSVAALTDQQLPAISSPRPQVSSSVVAAPVIRRMDSVATVAMDPASVAEISLAPEGNSDASIGVASETVPVLTEGTGSEKELDDAPAAEAQILAGGVALPAPAAEPETDANAAGAAGAPVVDAALGVVTAEPAADNDIVVHEVDGGDLEVDGSGLEAGLVKEKSADSQPVKETQADEAT